MFFLKVLVVWKSHDWTTSKQSNCTCHTYHLYSKKFSVVIEYCFGFFFNRQRLRQLHRQRYREARLARSGQRWSEDHAEVKKTVVYYITINQTKLVLFSNKTIQLSLVFVFVKDALARHRRHGHRFGSEGRGQTFHSKVFFRFVLNYNLKRLFIFDSHIKQILILGFRFIT